MVHTPRHSFALHHAGQGRWNIMGESDTQVFRGTLAECEAWLDREERTATGIAPKRNLTASVMSWMHRLYGRPAHSAIHK